LLRFGDGIRAARLNRPGNQLTPEAPVMAMNTVDRAGNDSAHAARGRHEGADGTTGFVKDSAAASIWATVLGMRSSTACADGLMS
jgi:hypothetical protein